MKKRSLLSFILVLVLVSSVLTACGGKASKNPANPDSAGAGKNSGGSEAPEVVNIAISENILTLDPHDWTNLPSLSANLMTYDYLIESDHEGNYFPSLATEWEASEDGLVWTFHLREGVEFHNGEEFNADDVVTSYNRLLENNSLAVYTAYWPVLKAVEKVDEYTVNLIMNESFGPVEYAVSNTAIIPDGAWAELGEAMFPEQKCYGTGPWILNEWVDGQYTHFTKNENYWGDFDSAYNEVYFRHILEPSSAIAGQLSGDIDAYISSGGISTDVLQLYGGSEDKTELVVIDSGAFQYMGFQTKEGSPFADINLRKAFEYAIDRQLIIDNILGGGKVPSGIIVDTAMGYDPALASYEYNAELAKEYLEKSNYNGEPIVLSSNTSTLKSEEILLAVSAMINAIGFNSTIEVVENATLGEMRATGEYDLFMVTNMHPGGDPFAHLTSRILNDSHHSNYVNAELNEMIAKSNSEVDPEKRAEYITEANRIIREESAPQTNLSQLQTTQAVNYGVSGLLLYTDGYFNYKWVTYDPSLVK